MTPAFIESKHISRYNKYHRSTLRKIDGFSSLGLYIYFVNNQQQQLLHFKLLSQSIYYIKICFILPLNILFLNPRLTYFFPEFVDAHSLNTVCSPYKVSLKKNPITSAVSQKRQNQNLTNHLQKKKKRKGKKRKRDTRINYKDACKKCFVTANQTIITEDTQLGSV